MKKKCDCPCHTDKPGMIHIQPCCDNGFITVGPLLRVEFDRSEYDSQYPKEDWLKHYKDRAAHDLLHEISSGIEWDAHRINSMTERYVGEIAVYSPSEIRHILVDLKLLKQSLHSLTLRKMIDDIMRKINPSNI